MTYAPVQPRINATAAHITGAAQPRRRDPDGAGRRGRSDPRTGGTLRPGRPRRPARQVGARVARTDTVVCVVGEFKKGKSALHQRPARHRACARSTTTSRRRPSPSSATRQSRVPPSSGEDGGLIVESIPADDAGWAVETDGEDRRHASSSSRWACRTVPRAGRRPRRYARGRWPQCRPRCGHPGLPAVGRRPRVRDRCLGRAVRPELDFLGNARRAGPPILVAITKVDIYPAWHGSRQSTRTLGPQNDDAVSDRLRRAAGRGPGPGRRGDRRERYGAFSDASSRHAVEPRSCGQPAAAAVGDVCHARQLREPSAAERTALEHPEQAQRSSRPAVRDAPRGPRQADSAWSDPARGRVRHRADARRV